MLDRPKELDCVLLADGTKATVLEAYDDGHLLLEKEIPSPGEYPDYEQFESVVDRVAKIIYRSK